MFGEMLETSSLGRNLVMIKKMDVFKTLTIRISVYLNYRFIQWMNKKQIGLKEEIFTRRNGSVLKISK